LKHVDGLSAETAKLCFKWEQRRGAEISGRKGEGAGNRKKAKGRRQGGQGKGEIATKRRQGAEDKRQGKTMGKRQG